MERSLVSLVAAALLCATGTAQETAPEKEGSPLVLEVLDPHHPRNRGRLEEGRPPIVFEGVQASSLVELRARLKQRGDRDRNPDRSVGEIAPGIRPSAKELVLRCDGTQVFGWVQAILQCCTFVPGRSRSDELRQSPLIYRIAIEAAGTGRRMKTWLPVDSGLMEMPTRQAEISLKAPRSAMSKAAHEQEIVFLMGGSDVPLGRSRGLAFHSEKPDDHSMLLDPPDTLLRVRRFLSEFRKRHPKGTAKLNAWPRVPIAYAMEVVEAMHEAGYQEITYSGIPSGLMADLERGALNAPGGLTTLREQIQVAVPEAEPGPAVGTRGAGGTLGGRRGGQRNLRTRGGGGRTQRVVDSGLAWLAEHQSSDGSWDGDGFSANCDHGSGEGCDGQGIATHDVGLTGLSLLAFLGAGHTHREGTHKAAVRQGLKWLRSRQDAEGCFGGRESPHFSYNHAIAALAMAEAYGMTRSGIWKGSAQNGIDFCLAMQNPGAGWRYGVRPGDSDTSVTAWMAVALKSASMARLDVNPSALESARTFIDKMTDPKTGRTGYTRPGERPVRAEGRLETYPANASESLTGAGMIVRIFSGENPKESAMLNAGAGLIVKRLPRWEPREGSVDMYYWYWATLAMFQMGGTLWPAWNEALKPAVVDSQIQEGPAAGSWDPVGPWGADGGRIYSTALMTLCLEVYYRYARLSRDR